MTITMIALFSSALFLIPAFLMPHNRLRAIIISLLPGVFILTGLYFCDLFFVSIDLNTKIGTIFLPMWNPFFQGFEELSLVEKHHFSPLISSSALTRVFAGLSAGYTVHLTLLFLSFLPMVFGFSF